MGRPDSEWLISVSPIIKKLLMYAVFFILISAFSHGLNCTGDPCMYGICLEDDNSSYSCYCIDGYTGINCEINWDDCWSNPCLNGGTCNDAVAAYNCTCVEGFVGINCEQKYSECSNQPCLNNGTCVDYDGFICQCPDGYSGEYCEIDASVCNDTICKNSGECVEGPGFSFFCRCPEGWTGRLCEEDVDECITSPCKNGGLCINVPASYTCACLFGYTGKDCDKAIVPCDENPCENGAVCLLEDERPVCYCVPDYHGALCELRYDDCESKFANCANGGTCIDGINTFTCSCPALYTGRLCDVYTLPSTILPTLETSSDFEVKKTTASSSSSSRMTSISASTMSLYTISSPTALSSTPLASTSRSYTKWYPFTETTISERNDTILHSSIATGSTLMLTETSPMYSTAAKETVHEEFGTTLPRTFSETSREVSTVALTTATPEIFTGKTSHEEKTTRASINEDLGNVTSITMSDSLTEETSTTTGYIHTSRYYSTVTPFIEKSTSGTTTMKDGRSTGEATPTVPSFSITDFLQNKTSEMSTVTVFTLKTTAPSLIDKSTMMIPAQTVVTDEETVTFPVLSTDSVPTSTTTSKSSVISNTTFTVTEEGLTVKDQIGTTESGDCHGIVCPTKPTVPRMRNDSECNCTQRENDCKNGPAIIQAAFSGKSYARQQVNVNVINDNNATLHVLVRLRTLLKSGIILHVYFDDQKYALVYLELSSLKFQFSCGLETMLLGEIDTPINNGYEVDIDVRFQYFIEEEVNKCSARLLVNGTTAVSGEQILPAHGSLPRHANLHLGGIPVALSQYFSHVSMGFIGCMSSLKVNDVLRHFIYDSIETFQIEDCVSFLCLSSPCQNFGACEEVNGTIRCKCIAGYTGPFCERSACDENPCALGATCISSPGAGFVCVCPLGTHGLLCEEDMVIARPSFSVLVPGFSSYIAYGVSTSIRDAMELQLKIIPRTIEQISLIAYLGQSGSRRDLSDHLSVTYVRGYIMLTWDLGAGVRRIFTSVPLSTALTSTPTAKSYKAHTVRVGRRGQDAWLAVDDIGNVTGRVFGSMTRLDVSPILYIGGHKSKNFGALPHDLPLHTGFSGCIFDVELRTGNTILPITRSSPATGRGVGECHRNECIRHSCKNGAVCLSHGATYSCVCTKEWMGSDCSIPMEISSSIHRPPCQGIGERK